MIVSSTQCCDFGTDPDPRIRTRDLRSRILLFRQWLSRCQQKTIFISKVFPSHSLKVHLHQSSKIKSLKEFTKQ
jgi:hypothetical protein